MNPLNDVDLSSRWPIRAHHPYRRPQSTSCRHVGNVVDKEPSVRVRSLSRAGQRDWSERSEGTHLGHKSLGITVSLPVLRRDLERHCASLVGRYAAADAKVSVVCAVLVVREDNSQALGLGRLERQVVGASVVVGVSRLEVKRLEKRGSLRGCAQQSAPDPSTQRCLPPPREFHAVHLIHTRLAASSPAPFERPQPPAPETSQRPRARPLHGGRADPAFHTALTLTLLFKRYT